MRVPDRLHGQLVRDRRAHLPARLHVQRRSGNVCAIERRLVILRVRGPLARCVSCSRCVRSACFNVLSSLCWCRRVWSEPNCSTRYEAQLVRSSSGKGSTFPPYMIAVVVVVPLAVIVVILVVRRE